MCKLLVNRGCDPLVVDKFKKTAMSFAKTNNHLHVSDYLNMFKKQKGHKMKSNSESMQIEKKGKKKQVPKVEYVLAYTGDNGESKILNGQESDDFLNKNERIKILL